MPHYDVIKWEHFPRYWPFVRGKQRSPVNSPHKGQWRRALMFFFIFAWINGWVNNREAGDLRRHCAHYDVIVMRRNWLSSVKPCYCPTRSQYPRDILNWHEWTLIPAWIKSYIHYAVWHDITYPFPKFNGCSSLGMTGNFTPRFMMEVFTYPWWDWS